MNVEINPIIASSGAVRCFCDGATGGANPGPLGIGISVVDADGIEIHAISEALGKVGTSNIAEYSALHRALEWCAASGHLRPHVLMDSQLVIRQVQGQFAVRHDGLIPLHAYAVELVRALNATLEWIPRERNGRADQLSKRAFMAFLTLTPQLRATIAAMLQPAAGEEPSIQPAVRELLEEAITASDDVVCNRLLQLRSGHDIYTNLKGDALAKVAIARHGIEEIERLSGIVAKRSTRTQSNVLRWAARGLPVALALAKVNLEKAAAAPYIRSVTGGA